MQGTLATGQKSAAYKRESIEAVEVALVDTEVAVVSLDELGLVIGESSSGVAGKRWATSGSHRQITLM
jgi:hypothetical protein